MASGELWGYQSTSGFGFGGAGEPFNIGWIEDPEIRAAAIRAAAAGRRQNTINYNYVTQKMASERADEVIKEKLQQIQKTTEDKGTIFNIGFRDNTPEVKAKKYSLSSSMIADIDAEVLRQVELESNIKQFEELKERRRIAASTARQQAQAKSLELTRDINAIQDAIQQNEQAGLSIEQGINALNAKKEQYEIQKRNIELYSELDDISYDEGFMTSSVNRQSINVASEVSNFLEKIRRGNIDSFNSKQMFLPLDANDPRVRAAYAERDKKIRNIAEEKAKFESFLAEARRSPETFKERVLNYAKALYERFGSKYYDFESMTGEEIEEYSRQRTLAGTITRVIYPGKTDALGRAIKSAKTTKESQNLINYSGQGGSGPDSNVNQSFYGWFGLDFASPRAIKIGYLGCLCASESGVQRDMPIGLWRTKGDSSELLQSVTINPGDSNVYYDGTYMFKKIPAITLRNDYTYVAAVYYRSIEQDTRQNDRYHYFVTDGPVHVVDGDLGEINFQLDEIYTLETNPSKILWGDETGIRDFANFGATPLEAANVAFRTDGFFTGKPRENFVYRQDRI